MEIPLLEGAHRIQCALGPRAKQRLHKNLGQTYLWVLEGLLGKQGSAVPHSGGMTLDAEIPGNNHCHELPWKLPFWKNTVPKSEVRSLRSNNKQGGNTAPSTSKQAA